MLIEGFPWWLIGKESSCNAGKPSLIPGSVSSPGAGNGYPLQTPIFVPGESHGQRAWRCQG